MTIKRLLAISMLVMLVMLVFSMAVAEDAYDIPKVSSEFYVNDNSEVFSLEEKYLLIERAKELDNALFKYNGEKIRGIQVVVTTVGDTGGIDIEAYAEAMYNQYEIGEESMGVLILLVTEGDNRGIAVLPGTSMKKYISKTKADDLIDKYGWDDILDHNFDKALNKLQQGVINYIYGAVPGIEKPTVEPVVTATKVPAVTTTPKLKATLGNTESNDESEGDGHMIWMVATFVMSGIAIVLAICKRKADNRVYEVENECEQKIQEACESANKKLSDECSRTVAVRQEKDALSSQLSASKRDYDKLAEWAEWVRKAYPEIDAAILETKRLVKIERDKEAVVGVNQVITDIFNFNPNRSYLNAASLALREITELTEDQKQYLARPESEVRDYFEKCKADHDAYVAELERQKSIALACGTKEKVEAILSRCSGVERDLPELERAGMLISELETKAKEYFNDNFGDVKERLHKLLDDANEDKARNDQAEADRASAEMLTAIAFMAGRASEEERLRHIVNSYNSKPSHIRNRMNQETIMKANNLYARAREEREAEDRRRRQASSSSSFGHASGGGGSSRGSGSGFSSRSSFGGGSSRGAGAGRSGSGRTKGHGGSSSGGGASRKF